MAVPVTDMIVSTAEDGVVAETTSIKDPNLAMAQSDVNNVLLEIISRFSGATYAGVATPETAPGTPLLKVFYLTTTAGEYANFGNLTVESGKLTVLLFNGSTWEKQVLDLPTSGGGSTVNVVQATGTSTTDVMSQKAVTDELMGVEQNLITLGSEVGIRRDIQDDDLEVLDKWVILNNANWYFQNSSFQKCGLFSFLKNAYGKIIISANPNGDAQIGFLKSDNHESGVLADWCEGKNLYDVVSAGESKEINIPSDCTVIYIKINNADGHDAYPKSITLIPNGLSQYISSVKGKIDSLPGGFEEYDISDPSIGYVITKNSSVSKLSAYNVSEPIKVSRGDIIRCKFGCQDTAAAICVTDLGEIESRPHDVVVVGKGYSVQEYSYTVGKDCYIELCYVALNGVTPVKIEHENVQQRLDKIEDESNNAASSFWCYALENILLIGDSLTEGATASQGWGGNYWQ